MEFVIELLERHLANETKYLNEHNPIPGLSDITNDALLKSKTMASKRIGQLEAALKILKV